MIVDPVDPPETCDIANTTYQAESITQNVGGQRDQYWNIWSNGSIETKHNFSGQETMIVVQAAGELAGSDLPVMTVRVNGTSLGSVEVASTSASSYAFSFDAQPGEATISVHFENDYFVDNQDRNLLVDWIMVDECN